jgi:hypothetical protein
MNVVAAAPPGLTWPEDNQLAVTAHPETDAEKRQSVSWKRPVLNAWQVR